MRYTVNSPMVITENIDGEVIVLNMESGKYYSTQGTGIAVWQLLSGGYLDEEAVDLLAAKYPADKPAIVEAVAEMKRLFIDDKLIKVADSQEPAATRLEEVPPGPFERPEFNVYTDMQGLLLLDPIHEVEDMGWPQKQAGDSN